MMRTRYNKKRNTAFVYEVLIREGTSAILQKDEQRKNAIVKIIKKHFSTRSLLYKDLECYQSLQERQSLSEDKCLRVVKEARMQKRMIDPSTLFKQQTNLIKDVNKEFNFNYEGDISLKKCSENTIVLSATSGNFKFSLDGFSKISDYDVAIQDKQEVFS